MDNIKDDKYYLDKIINDITFIIENTKDLSEEEFDNDEVIVSAVNFKLIQISENANKLSENLVISNTNIPWFKIKGLRNKIVHDYDGVYLYIVFNTIQKDLPKLLEEFKSLY